MNLIEYIDVVVKQILNNFDFSFMVIVNLITYYLIKVVDKANGDKVLNTWHKRIILMICTVIAGVVYKLTGYGNDIVLINSAILAPVFWDWILRPIFIKLGIGYKSIDDCFK